MAMLPKLQFVTGRKQKQQQQKKN